MRTIFAEFTVSLPDGSLTLVCNFKALAAIEKHFPLPSLIDDLANGRVGVTAMAVLVWGLLRERHPRISEDQALGLTLDHGDALGTAIGEVFEAAFPAPGGASDPQKAGSGTG